MDKTTNRIKGRRGDENEVKEITVIIGNGEGREKVGKTGHIRVIPLYLKLLSEYLGRLLASKPREIYSV